MERREYPLSDEQIKRLVNFCEKKGNLVVLFYPYKIIIESYKDDGNIVYLDGTYTIYNEGDIELIFGVNGRKEILGF